METTPLQDKLEAIATDIGKLGMYCALLTVHILLLRFFIERLVNRTFDLFGDDTADNQRIGDYLREWLRYFVIGVAILIGGVLLEVDFEIEGFLEEVVFVLDGILVEVGVHS